MFLLLFSCVCTKYEKLIAMFGDITQKLSLAKLSLSRFGTDAKKTIHNTLKALKCSLCQVHVLKSSNFFIYFHQSEIADWKQIQV